MKSLATVGYEGCTPADFDERLVRAGVDLVVDVRAVAVSRRRGFSKTGLSERLRASGIDYLHLRALGDPKPGREAARAGDFSLFRKIFAEHLRTSAAKTQLAELKEIVGERRVALLCFEADAEHCHRTIIAGQIAKTQKLSIVHLRVNEGIEDDVTDGRESRGSRQSLAAA